MLSSAPVLVSANAARLCATWLCVLSLLSNLLACGGRVIPPATAQARLPACRIDETWSKATCTKLGAERSALESGLEHLAAFETAEAIAALNDAKRQGPYRHADHVRLYEALGTAQAYAGNNVLANEAFDQLLILSPGHAISYTLSPKVTFLFERARRRAGEPPQLLISWPRDQVVSDPTAIEIDSSRASTMRHARLHYRRKGDQSWFWADYELPAPGDFATAVLPPLDADATSPQVMQMFAVGFDAAGNEVGRWGHPLRPRELSLRYDPPSPWYERWWVWTIAGVVIATGTGIAVFAATREPPPTADGMLTIP